MKKIKLIIFLLLVNTSFANAFNITNINSNISGSTYTNIEQIKQTSKINDVFFIEGYVNITTDENYDLIYEFEDSNANKALLYIPKLLVRKNDINTITNEVVILKVKVLRNVSGNLELEVLNVERIINN